MQMKQCSKGHFYDPLRHSTCPFCGVPSLDIPNVTRAKRPDEYVAPPNQPLAVTVAKREGISPTEGRTVGLIQKKQGIDPAVGWLVCVDGPERGRDYRIRSENNFLGRLETNDIQIKGDDAISKEKHAIITYDPECNQFIIQPGGGRGLVYLNNQPVYAFTQLKIYDQIKVGQTTLIFIPLCGEHFKWEKPAQSEA